MPRIMKTRRSVFLGTLPLNPTDVATQLLDVYAPNANLDKLSAGSPVGVDNTGYAIPADTTAKYIGIIEAPAKEGMGVNLHGLANKQITYIKGPCEFETNNFKVGVAYAAGDTFGVGAVGDLGPYGAANGLCLIKTATAADILGVIMSARSAAVGDNEVSLICILNA